MWGRAILDDRTRQIAAVATFAALGMPDPMRVHVDYALNVGVSEVELKEVVYLTTRFPLERIAEAHEAVEGARAGGRVVVEVG